jgi:serine/threonine protein phosphatase PrpC
VCRADNPRGGEPVLRAHGISDRGRIRPTNEDCFAIQEELGLCVIADGMGGHNAGEVAARIAVDAVVDACRTARSGLGSGLWHEDPASGPEGRWPFGYDGGFSEDANLLRTAILVANFQILEAAITTDHWAGMGTTVVAARVAGGRLTVGHVGDSRLYLLAGGALRQVTRDDSWVASMLAVDPGADPLLLQHHPMRHALTNVVGARSGTDVHVQEETLASPARLLLTTDGVHSVLNDGVLERLLTEDDDPPAIAARIVAAALGRGSRDNCTAIVARFEGH